MLLYIKHNRSKYWSNHAGRDTCILDNLIVIIFRLYGCCLGFHLLNPDFLFLGSQIPTLMQQLVILLDEPFQRLLGPGLRLKEIGLLIPGLLHLPTLLRHRIAILMAYPGGCHVIPIFDIHDGLCPDDGSISNLYLVPEDVKRIRGHLLDNRNGLLRQVLAEETEFFCVFILFWGRAAFITKGVLTPFRRPLFMRTFAFLIRAFVIPLMSTLPAADRPLWQIQLICNLNQFNAFQVHGLCLLYPWIWRPGHADHLFYVCFVRRPRMP